MAKTLSMGTRRELIEAVGRQYRASPGSERSQILDEFVRVTGYHRKHAIRVLSRKHTANAERGNRQRIYDQPVQSAVTLLWWAADRICGKRLKALLPTRSTWSSTAAARSSMATSCILALSALARLYEASRLYVNFFQPCFKLKSKQRDGAQVRKFHYPPATPYQRVLASAADGRRLLRGSPRTSRDLATGRVRGLPFVRNSHRE